MIGDIVEEVKLNLTRASFAPVKRAPDSNLSHTRQLLA
jgi:hypothetical protein